MNVPFLYPFSKLFQRISLKRKFFIILFLTSSLSLLFTCSAIIVSDLLEIRKSMIQALSTQARLIAENSTIALVFNDAQEAEEILQIFQHQPDILQAILFTAEGTILAQSHPGPPPGWFPNSETLVSKFSWESVELFREISFDGTQVGTIYLKSNLRRLYERFTHLLLVSGSAMVFFILLALVIASRFQKAILDPLAHLTQIASQISQERDYSLRAKSHRSDEIGMLINGFNEMVQQIQDRDVELAQHRNHLAEKVEERTSELSEMNSRLQQEVTEKELIESQLLETAKTLKIRNHELSLSRDEALQAAQAKADFLATMSHEIRTPMNGVLGMTGLLLETNLTVNQKYLAETVQTSAEALLTLLNDILDFSKIEAGKLELEHIDFDLHTTLDESLDLLAERAASKHLELTGLIFPDVPTSLKGDPGRLRQILLNLLGNAIKFTNQGEVSIQILKEEETSNDVILRFHVWDSGIGIPDEVQNKLFSSFSQADSSTTRKYGGSGLGLAICKQLVELMGGEIGLASQPEAWSLFWFSLCLQKSPPGNKHEWIPRTDLQGLRMCCIDDNPINLFLLESYAKSWGMETFTTTNPELGISALRQAASAGQPFDLAIIDREMPPNDGMTIGRSIQQEPLLTQTKLVLLATIGERGEATIAHQAGFAAYLTKPIRKMALYNGLATVMGYCYTNQVDHVRPLVTRHTVKELQRRCRGKILIVDDHTINQELIVLLLERLGFSSDVANGGREAVSAFGSREYVLILMDCQMPEMDGYEATKHIRQLETHRHQAIGIVETEDHISGQETPPDPIPHRVPIIALTANVMPGDREKCLAAGMDDYLSKPIRSEELTFILQRWIPGQGESQSEENLSESTPVEAADLRAKRSPLVPDPFLPFPEEAIKETSSPIKSEILQEWQDMGGPDLLNRMLGQFISDASLCLQSIHSALQNHDLIALKEASHGLKGISANVGAIHLRDLASQLENTSQQGHFPTDPKLQGRLENELFKIQSLLTTLNPSFQFPPR